MEMSTFNMSTYELAIHTTYLGSGQKYASWDEIYFILSLVSGVDWLNYSLKVAIPLD